MITSAHLWAKLDRDDAGRVIGWHSLVHHSADVAAVFLALLGQPTVARRLETLSQGGDLNDIALARLAALVFIHDIGKANRGFRARVDPGAPRVGHIDQVGWLFGGEGGPLTERLFSVLGLDRMDSWFEDPAWNLFSAVFAHHGRPWNKRVQARQHWVAGPNGDPIGDLAAMRAALDAWFPAAFAPGPPLPDTPGFVHAFAGLVMLADWLGSDRAFFPFACGEAGDRFAFARDRAEQAVATVGLGVKHWRATVGRSRLDFTHLFGRPSPSPSQQTAALPRSGLVVLESETGSGKTEAALWRFAHLFTAGAVDGLYFALPTRVAATQMHTRLRRFVANLFGPNHPPVLCAVPGQVLLDDAKGHPLPNFGFEWSDDPGDGEQRARWAAEHPKRFLATQFAVGTIDQALLASLRVKHAHLRGAALLRLLLVVDEVHASDTYMEGLLTTLLRAHLAAGGHALLLSATLGGAARARLLGTPIPSRIAAEAVAYPALSWAEDGIERRMAPARGGSEKHVEVMTLPMLDQPEALARTAVAAAERGARVIVLRNTVGAAVATQHALEALAGHGHPALFRVAGAPTLHHGRFAVSDRGLLDRAVESVLGEMRGDGGLVVIGTQTLEQSLDLDADFLLTDLCPVDVLLQRIGRLHRHRRSRPPGFENPQAIVLVPAARDLVALARRGRHGLGSRVYEDLRVIEATWRLIERHRVWSIPEMNRALVEDATHPEVLAALWDELCARDPDWERHITTFAGGDRARALQAGLSVFDRTEPFEAFTVAEERLATRLGGADRQVVLEPAPIGPFGQPLTAMKIPYFWLGGVADSDDPDAVTGVDGSVTFKLGPVAFRYDRFGLTILRQ